MSWEARPTGRYYYHVRRQGGKLSKCYFGKGEIGNLAAEMDLAERFDRELQQAERVLIELGDRYLVSLEEILNLLAIGELCNHGYYKHGGEWRRHRGARPARD